MELEHKKEIISLDSYLRSFFESGIFQKIITSIIIINSVLIGLETSPIVMGVAGSLIDLFDNIILFLFVTELILKLFVYRKAFFKNSWNIFDFAIVLISIMPAASSFTVFRALRILRTLRLLKSIPKLRIIIESLLQSIPSIGWIGVLLGIIYYTFAVIGTSLYSTTYPEYFGDLGKTFFTLFQIMTLESWSSLIARPIMEGAPFAAIYFVSFILIATYTTLNIFIAVVVNNMNEVNLKDFKEEEEHLKDFIKNHNNEVLNRLKMLQKEITQLKNKVKENESIESTIY